MDSLTSIPDVTVWTPMSWDYQIKIKKHKLSTAQEKIIPFLNKREQSQIYTKPGIKK